MSASQPTLPIHYMRPFPDDKTIIPANLLSLPRPAPVENPSYTSAQEDLQTVGTRRKPGTTSATGLDHNESENALDSTTEGISKPKERQEFNVAIFCALALESDAVISLMDQHWDRREYGKVLYDTNSYTLGAIGVHKVVLVHLPGMGKGVAASAASSCRVSFPGIRLALVVGICGGVPFGSGNVERILGDVIISDGLVQYDFGRQFPNQFKRKRTLHDNHSRPASEIRSFLARLSGRGARLKSLQAARNYLITLQSAQEAADAGIYGYPGVEADILYEASSLHKHLDASSCPDWELTCGSIGACDLAQILDCQELSCTGQLTTRRRLKVPGEHGSQASSEASSSLIIFDMHIGTIASGDKVMKSGEERDRVAKEEGIIAFEMEGAGIWDHFPCLIIKGICDYSDCHKNKKWQHYAAATAASYMRAVLDEWD
ncbi:putative kinesin [Fusarium austroafricanum]|uniref:Putative kinesin n=1 Tax=Fusarium austroafricanum TaxID=2364996 RepID=A0A8H4KQJ2_9HYPO|nr:putative kinesin [Fusarium austroafricanum]